MNKIKDKQRYILQIITALIIIVVIFLIATSQFLNGGIVVDKYRISRGVEYLVIKKEDVYQKISVEPNEYYSFDIGDTYSREWN